MNIKKCAFTLAEVLLTLGIIAIVTTMGMTISKKGAEQAYNNYYFTGYINLYNAIADLIEYGNDWYDTNGKITVNGADITVPSAIKSINDTLGTENSFATETSSVGDKWYIITAANGITYSINTTDKIRFIMSVPAIKKRSTGDSINVAMIYQECDRAFCGEPQDLLIPVEPNAAHLQNYWRNYSAGQFVNMADRIDLLAAFIDDGLVGRAIKEIEHNGESTNFEPIKYMTYHQAVCAMYKNEHSGSTDNIQYTLGGTNVNAIECDNAVLGEVPPGQHGILKVVSPRATRW